MEIKKDGADTVEIFLSADDLSLYGLTYSQIDYCNLQTKIMFSELLNSAKRHFTEKVSKYLIEVFPFPKGGCVIYLTPQKKENVAAKRYRIRGRRRPTSIFKFENIDHLVRAVEVSAKEKQNIKSFLYLHKEKYYLVIYEKISQTQNRIFSEFASKEPNTACFVSMLCEHGKLICSPFAIKTFYNTFV